MEDNESSRFAKFQKALEDGKVTDEEKAEFRVQGLLGRLAKRRPGERPSRPKITTRF